MNERRIEVSLLNVSREEQEELKDYLEKKFGNGQNTKQQ
jgi:hypothetical protein